MRRFSLLQREREHLNVVFGGVGPRVPGSQDRSERFAGLRQPAPDRVKPVAMLIGSRRSVLLRVRRQQRRIDIQRDRGGARTRYPRLSRAVALADRTRGCPARSIALIVRCVVVSEATIPNSRCCPRKASGP